MHVRLVDPSAYTPPYDHALASALVRAGARVTLATSEFPYGDVPGPEGYAIERRFYRRGRGPAGSLQRRITKLASHVPDMRALRRDARDADVVHFQWLALQQLDGLLLPRGRPVVLTAHDVLPREPRPGQLRAQERLYQRVDAVVVHSHHGRDRLVGQLDVDPATVHVIPHGAFAHLAAVERAALPRPLDAVKRPVVLLFGLVRPYKGLDVLLDAWHRLGGDRAPAELWVVGLPKMDLAPLKAQAPPGVRFVDRFVADEEAAAFFDRADVVVLPYREIDQSGVLFTGLAFGKPLVLSDVGGFPEIAAEGAAELVPAGDAAALATALEHLLVDRERRRELGIRAGALARGPYSWDAVAHAHLELYRALLGG
ncbi:glycosyltransferase family 4 protein [Patulibacter brassicae]|uniref:Glycosyltransferase family 4 protein n=1 Tax=Patulibacter brassicae TaxID=1705717 RepID=A0ABU4VKP0_9ACTN|nr:glycosyltransferase family 4 protein [Patulibacter brassicae]MDX8152424.1 glycosyltransferase family 4 protein [Patulibacter brassicae]